MTFNPEQITVEHLSIVFDVIIAVALISIAIGVFEGPMADFGDIVAKTGLLWFVFGMVGKICAERLYPAYRAHIENKRTRFDDGGEDN